MRGHRDRGGWLLLTAVLALLPTAVYGQGYQYAPPSTILPFPLGSTRPEEGGLYTFGSFAMYRQTNPLKSQVLAIRGFQASDNSIPTSVTTGVPIVRNLLLPVGQTLAQNQTLVLDAAGNPIIIFAGNGNPQFVLIQQTDPPAVGQVVTVPRGTFLGPGTPALNVAQLTGNDSYQPGLDVGFGWKFSDGSALELRWLYLTTAQYRAGATLAPPNSFTANANTFDSTLADTFLFSPVFNFPVEYSGPDNKIQSTLAQQPSPQAAFGIWNGASYSTIVFEQRFQQWDINYRSPIYETENYRLSGIVGPRFAWIWERFLWRTTSLDGNGGSSPDDQAIYTNIVSNRMYGVHASCEQEFYLGHGFAAHLELGGAVFLDSVKERAKYELANRYAGRPENKRAKSDWAIVPQLEARAGLMWYPTEFIQLRIDYNVMAYFNTLAGRHPVDFDYQNLSPHFSHTSRLFDGWRAGIGLLW